MFNFATEICPKNEKDDVYSYFLVVAQLRIQRL